MAGRGRAGGRGRGGVAHGALRWGLAERRLVMQYLNQGWLDPNRAGNAGYLHEIQQQEELWARHAARNFYQNVRQEIARWRVEQAVGGL